MGISIRRSRDLGSSSLTLPSGIINPFAGTTAPDGWLLCYGQVLSRSSYPDLFVALSTTYNIGGEAGTDFRIPDLRGRAIAGVDNMGGSAASRITSGIAGITATTLGATGGDQRVQLHSHTNTAAFTGTAASHTHIQDAHSHSVYDPSHAHNYTARYGGYQSIGQELNVPSWSTPYGLGGGYIEGAYASVSLYSSQPANQSTSVTPAGSVAMTNVDFGAGASQNLPPIIVLNYIIKA